MLCWPWDVHLFQEGSNEETGAKENFQVTLTMSISHCGLISGGVSAITTCKAGRHYHESPFCFLGTADHVLCTDICLKQVAWEPWKWMLKSTPSMHVRDLLSTEHDGPRACSGRWGGGSYLAQHPSPILPHRRHFENIHRMNGWRSKRCPQWQKFDKRTFQISKETAGQKLSVTPRQKSSHL